MGTGLPGSGLVIEADDLLAAPGLVVQHPVAVAPPLAGHGPLRHLEHLDLGLEIDDQVRLQLANFPYRFQTVFRFPDDLDILPAVQHGFKPFTKQLVVFDDENMMLAAQWVALPMFGLLTFRSKTGRRKQFRF